MEPISNGTRQTSASSQRVATPSGRGEYCDRAERHGVHSERPHKPSRPRGVREEPGKANRCEPNDGQRHELHRGRGPCEHVAANVGETAGTARKRASVVAAVGGRDGGASAIPAEKHAGRCAASWRDTPGFRLQLQMFRQRGLSRASCPTRTVRGRSIGESHRADRGWRAAISISQLDIRAGSGSGKPESSSCSSCRPPLVPSRVAHTSECAICRRARPPYVISCTYTSPATT